MLADAQWKKLEPLIEACRPKGKTPPQDLRRTISAILWGHQNGAKWRSVPSELGPWSREVKRSNGLPPGARSREVTGGLNAGPKRPVTHESSRSSRAWPLNGLPRACPPHGHHSDPR